MQYGDTTAASGGGAHRVRGDGRESWRRTGALALGLLSSASCGSEGDERSFEAARSFEPVGDARQWDATSAERFGISAQDSGGARPATAGSGPSWTVPEGWLELPSTQFREANFRVGGDERAECYLSSLSGEGGGLAANVNRWRTQMSLAPLSDEAIAALPRESWLGAPATFVDFTGTWTGMSGGEAAEDWRLVGLLRVEPGGSKFLKMTGPAERIAGELDSFRRLAASFRAGAPAGPVAHDHDGDGAPDHAEHAPEPMAGLPPGHPPTTPTSAAAAGASNTSPSGFLWTPGAGWARGADKAMREITYVVDGAECYVTLLAGDGGGLLANLGRWCQQMGQPAVSEEGLAALARVPMLGGSGALVELERGAGASGAPERLLGLVLLQEGRSLFVKMTGPRAVLEREREAFLEFCRSARSTS